MIRRTGKKRLLAIAIVIVIAALGLVAMGTPRSASPYHKLRIFAKVLSHIERIYVESIDENEIIYGAIRGMIRTLDPHSAFLMPDELEMLEADTKGRFGGVGVEVGVQNDVLTVIVPIEGTPAERAGVLPGDQIIAIEGKPTRTMSIEDVVRTMRGKPGTKVTITMRRKDVDKPLDITLIREVIRAASVRAELLSEGYPWIRVRSFQDGTTAEVKEAVDRLTRESGGLKGLILDLRRNPGGVLEEAVRMSDLFISSGLLVTTRGRDGRILQEFKAGKRGTIDSVPVVALVDGASASAAEIVAGALQDHGRALLVGMRSFGKGSVQSIIDLGEGFGLKLTIARYFTPKGRSIQVEGVVPDVAIESLKAPEPDAETAALSALVSEGDLPGHLKPEDTTRNEVEGADIEDYQLRIAFQLLGGLVRAGQAVEEGAGKR
ncbi:MAG: S41 family peptidase [Deltaproteobacteria bacterium]|nr:S41 family peptidase [Deltaproteobacteria bacterium]